MLNTTLPLLVGAMLLYSCLSISQDIVVLSASRTLGRLPPPQFFLAPWLHLRGGAGSWRTGRTPSSSEKKEEEEDSSSSATPEGPQSAFSKGVKGNVEEFEPEESSDETGRIQISGSEREQRRELEIQRIREGRKKASSR
jgi:hypothetical protein